MRHLKIATTLLGSLILTGVLALAGCGEDHGDHMRSDRDRYPVQAERHDSDRREVQQDSGRHEDRGSDSGHDSGHGDR
jgi:hypothetical protein